MNVSAAASAPATDAGNNVLGEGIRRTYGTNSFRAVRLGGQATLTSAELAGPFIVRRHWHRPDYTMGGAQEQSHPTSCTGVLTAFCCC